MFDIHWLYKTSQYAIVKADVTEHNDVTQRGSIVITLWRTSASQVTAISKKKKKKKKKKTLSEMKRMQEKESIMGVRGIDRKILPSGSQSDITQQAS